MSHSYAEVLARLVAYLDEHLEEKPSSPIGADSQLRQDLRLDSILSFEMIADLEDDYEISISLDEFRDVETVGDVATLVMSALAR